MYISLHNLNMLKILFTICIRVRISVWGLVHVINCVMVVSIFQQNYQKLHVFRGVMPCILSYLTSCGSNRLLLFKVAKFYATRAVLFYFALQLLSNQTIQRTFSKPTHFLSCSVIKYCPPDSYTF